MEGSTELVYRCLYCSFRCLSWREFNRHCFETHSNQPNFNIKCVVVGCPQTFRSYSAFSSHLSRKHRGVNFESEARITVLSCNVCSHESEEVNILPSSTEAETDVGVSDDTELITSISDVCDENEIACTESSSRLERCAALFLLTAKERYQLTQSALDFITQQIQCMMSFAVDDIDEAVRNYLAEQGLSGTPFSNGRLETLRDPFMHLQTEYLQNKYYLKNFNLVVSVCCVYFLL